MHTVNIVDDITNSIAKKLFQKFGDSFFIYTKNIQQNFKTPSFSIINTHYSISPKRNGRFFCKSSFIIRCIGDEFNSDIYNKLFFTLNYIDVIDGVAEISNVNTNLVDNIFNFSFDCNFFIFINDDIDKMNDFKCFFS